MSAKNLFASVQLVVGSALLIAAAPLLAWASFVYVRGEVPGSCGGETTRRAHRQPSQRWAPS